MNTTSKVMMASFLIILLAISTLSVSGLDAQNGVGGGATATSQVNYDSQDVNGGTLVFSENTLTIENLQLVADDSAGISIESGSVELVLIGNNSIQGGTGFAGIHVAPGSTLTISSESEGSLTVTGGSGVNSSAAGIGGNAAEYVNDKLDGCPGFGTIILESGNVSATGGTSNNNSGAGIGSGGVNSNNNDTALTINGAITICGGSVKAYGGTTTNSSGYCGGAGIGSGATNGSDCLSDILISISNGKVESHGAKNTVNGGADAAGIGNGANINSSGTISISGGTILAHGTSEGGGWGGAGIGGGSNSYSDITISGGRIIAYTDSTGASAIGDGDMGASGTIIITGGTITIPADSKGYDLKGKIIKITGGSVYAHNIDGSPQDNLGNPVHMVQIIFDDISTETRILSLNVESYGMNDVFTDGNGFIFPWLPVGTELTSADSEDEKYGPVTPFTVGSNQDENKVEFSVMEPHRIIIETTPYGTITSSHESAYRDTRVTLTIASNQGYILSSITVDGVTVSHSGGSYSFTMPDHDVKVHAEFLPLMYTVEFYVDGEIYHSKNYSHGEPIIAPDDPSKEPTEETAFEFHHWEGYSDGMTATDDFDFYAVFDEANRMYTVVFESEGSVFYTYDAPYGSLVTKPADSPSREGYRFSGWDGYTEGMTVTGDMTFSAMFESIANEHPSLPPIPIPDDDAWIPPNIVVIEEEDRTSEIWIFVVLGCVAILLFLVFARYERKD